MSLANILSPNSRELYCKSTTFSNSSGGSTSFQYSGSEATKIVLPETVDPDEVANQALAATRVEDGVITTSWVPMSGFSSNAFLKGSYQSSYSGRKIVSIGDADALTMQMQKFVSQNFPAGADTDPIPDDEAVWYSPGSAFAGTAGFPAISCQRDGLYQIIVTVTTQAGNDAGSHGLSLRQQSTPVGGNPLIAGTEAKYFGTANNLDNMIVIVQTWDEVALNAGDPVFACYTLYGPQNNAYVTRCTIVASRVADLPAPIPPP